MRRYLIVLPKVVAVLALLALAGPSGGRCARIEVKGNSSVGQALAVNTRSLEPLDR